MGLERKFAYRSFCSLVGFAYDLVTGFKSSRDLSADASQMQKFFPSGGEAVVGGVSEDMSDYRLRTQRFSDRLPFVQFGSSLGLVLYGFSPDPSSVVGGSLSFAFMASMAVLKLSYYAIGRTAHADHVGAIADWYANRSIPSFDSSRIPDSLAVDDSRLVVDRDTQREFPLLGHNVTQPGRYDS